MKEIKISQNLGQMSLMGSGLAAHARLLQSLLIALGLLAFGCSRDNTAPGDPQDPDEAAFLKKMGERTGTEPVESPFIAKIPTPPAVQNNNEELKVDLRCSGEAKSCPQGLGLLVSREKHDMRICTAILTDRETVVVPKQCLSPTLRIPGKKCHDRVSFYLPNMTNDPKDAKSIRLGCDEVQTLTMDDDSEQNAVPGVAVLKLTNPHPNVKGHWDFAKQTPGLVSGDKLRALVIEKVVALADEATLSAELRVIPDCQVVQKSVFMPGFDSPYRSVGLVGGCAIDKPEYRGGLLVNASNDPVALIQEKIETKSGSEKSLAKGLSVTPVNLTRVDNIACLNVSTGKESQKLGFYQDCIQPVKKEVFSVEDIVALESDESKSQLESDMGIEAQAVENANVPFRFRMSPIKEWKASTMSLTLAATPTCFDPKLVLIAKKDVKVDKARQSVELSIPIVLRTLQFNAFGQVTSKLTRSDSDTGQLKLDFNATELKDPYDLKTFKVLEPEITITMNLGKQSVTQTRKMLPCAKK